MKKFKQFSRFILTIAILLPLTSCVVLVSKDNGRHRGWYKNSNNPHHPNSTNPGNSNGKQKGDHSKHLNFN